MKIQLKINGEWAVLPPDISLKIVKNSPLFSEHGDMSFPFLLDVLKNSHIFKNISDTFGMLRLREFHGLPAEIWYDGNKFFVGQTEIGNEQNFESGKISLNVVSNNSTFNDMIHGLNCQDVKLKDRIFVGWRPSRVVWDFTGPDYRFAGLKDGTGVVIGVPTKIGYYDAVEIKTFHSDSVLGDCKEVSLPPVLFNGLATNVSLPYPEKPYCNVRMCCANTKDANTNTDSDDSTGYGYRVIEADKNNCAPSFFVLYFLDCLFGKECLDVLYDNSSLFEDGDKSKPKIEDLCRLAFFNSYVRFDDDLANEKRIHPVDLREYIGAENCYYRLSSKLSVSVSYGSVMAYSGDPTGVTTRYLVKNKTDKMASLDWRVDSSWYRYDCYANSKNFPDVSVENVVSDLKRAFGIIFDYDQENNYMKLHMVHEIMDDTDVQTPQHIILKEPTVMRSMRNGYILSYGVDDDTNFNYRMPAGTDKYGKPDPVFFDDYLSLSSSVRKRTDYHTYYNRQTCDAFRIKVNKDTGNEPQFFSVSAYRDYKIGVCKDERYRTHNVFNSGNIYDSEDTKVYADRDESNAEKEEIHFKPVTINDVWSYLANKDKTVGVDVFDYPESSADQDLCVFVDAEAFNNHNGVDVYHCPKDTDNTKKYYKIPIDITTGNPPEERHFTFVESKKPSSTPSMLTSTAEMLSVDKVTYIGGVKVKVHTSIEVTLSGDCAFDLSSEEHYLAKANPGYSLGVMRGPGNKSDGDVVTDYDGEGNDSWVLTYDKPAFTADSIDLYGQVFDYNGTETGGASMAGRISLLLDARKVKEYDNDGNPVYYDTSNDSFANRGLVPQFLEKFLYFKSHSVCVSIPVMMSLSQINNIDMLKWNRFGDYTGLIKSIVYDLDGNGLRNIVVQLNVWNA